MPANQLFFSNLISRGAGNGKLAATRPVRRPSAPPKARRMARAAGARNYDDSQRVSMVPYRPAAVRIPDPLHHQLGFPFPPSTPQIFVHEGSRQLVEKRLGAFLGERVILSV